MTNTYDMLLNPPPSKQPKVAGKKSDANLLANAQTNTEKRKQASKIGSQQAPQLRNKQPDREKQRPHQGNKQDIKTDAITDVMNDGMTSPLQDVNLKQWQEIIEDTETQNSALRLTTEERYAIEDVVNELRRQYGIKTSMNEIARLGLLWLIHDFKKNKKKALIHKVKKA